MLRKVVIGSGIVTLVPNVSAASPVADDRNPAKPPPMRPSDLPIYEAPHADYVDNMQSQAVKKPGVIRSTLQAPISAVREQVQVIWDQTEAVKHTAVDHFQEFQDRTDWIVKYLREEENKEIRMGAVAMGGLTGFIFGLRGGFFRRVIYAGAGTTAMGAVCFPDETRQVLVSNTALAKQYANIAYNFLYGVKPGDPQLELKFPELSFPKDFSEFLDMTSSVMATVTKAVMPPPTKESSEQKPSDKKD